MSDVAKRLRYLCSPDAERLSDYQRINSFVLAGHEAANLLDELEREVAALEHEAFDRYERGADK